jgi:kynureninase
MLVEPVSAFRLDRSYAEALDGQDDLAAYRDAFEIPTNAQGSPVVYLCGHSLGLMPRSVPDFVARELEDWARLGVRGHMHARTPWYSYHEVFRDNAARLVGGRPGEVVMMNSLTVNLHLMLTTFYQPSGRRRCILIEDNAFPSDRYAVASHVASRGLDPVETICVVTPRTGSGVLEPDDIERVLREHGHETAVVLMGGVNYFTGQWFDIGRVTELARAEGCVVGFDLAHAAGNVPLELHDWNVDFAVWCSYKYLNGGPGAVAGCFVHDRHGRNAALKRLAGWWGNDPATRFQMPLDFIPREGADGWQVSNPPILALAPVRASLEIFDEVGMARLRSKSVALTGYLARLLTALGEDVVSVITPVHPNARGCQLSLRVTRGTRALYEALEKMDIVVDFREPDIIRAAPVPLYNTFRDVWDFAAAVGKVFGIDLAADAPSRS